MYPTVWLLILVQFTFIVSEENVIIDDNTEAKDEFCMPGRRLNSFYWTGSNFKGIIRDDDHGGIFSWSAGTSSARIRAFHFKYNPNNGYFDRFKVFHESTDQPSFTNYIPFAGVHIDIHNTTVNVFIEFYRSVQYRIESDTSLTNNMVAFCLFELRQSELRKVREDLKAQPDFWQMCNMVKLDEHCYGPNDDSGKFENQENRLFPKELMRLAPNDSTTYVLLFIKQTSTLIRIRTRANGGHIGVTYNYVILNDGTSDYRDKWIEVQGQTDLDYHIIGSFDHYLRYYLVIKREKPIYEKDGTNTGKKEETLTLREITKLTNFPLQLGKEIDFREFFQCGFNYAKFYGTFTWCTVILFISLYCFSCTMMARKEGKRLAMGHDRVGSHMRPLAESEKHRVPSMYLQVTEANNWYVDHARKDRDALKIGQSIIQMAKGLLKINQNGKSLENLKKKLRGKKKGGKKVGSLK